MSYTSLTGGFRHRVGAFLRNNLHRLYGRGYDNLLSATVSEPPWLRAVWRWFGAPRVLPATLHIPYNASCYRKRVYREGGVWWCETTYTPPDRMLVDFQALIAQHMGLPKISHVRAYPQKQPPTTLESK